MSNSGRLIHNRIRCKICGSVIESKYTHDFVECKCGSCFVDGGHEYARYGGKNLDDIEEMFEWEPDTDSKLDINE